MRPTYVLITSAYNEERYIEETIRAVVSQTKLPLRWVIISDGSTDSTDAIIESYRRRYPFIGYLRVERDSNEHDGHPFGRVARRKAAAFAKGVESLTSLTYDYIGNIDGDVSIEPSWFEILISRMEQQPRLGIAGGFQYNMVGGRPLLHTRAERNVCGPLQLFRTRCFRDIGGGYAPRGHEDTIALIMARMNGWETRAFPDLKVYHHKTQTWTGRARYKAKYMLGTYDYILCDSLLWVILRCAKELPETPVVIGSVLRFAGYIRGALYETKVLPPKVQRFVRRDQYRLIRAAALRRA